MAAAETPETARRLIVDSYEAMNRGDLDRWLENVTSDFSLSEPPELPDADTYRGKEGGRRWAEMTMASLEDWGWTPEEFFFNDGSTVAVRLLLTGRSAAGVAIELPVFHIFEVRGGKIASVSSFLSKAEATAAAGLPENA